jgi:flagellar hook-length control protein FliK
VASVAADTSAIAPSPPPPSRSDPTAPAGPAGAFADILDAAAAPATPPQPQGTPGARTDDGSSAGQASRSSAAGASGAKPADAGAASSGPANGKASGGGKFSDDQSGDDNGADSASAVVTVTAVAGLALPPFAFASLPATDQTPAASQDTATASSDSAAPTGDDTSRAPADRKDADPSSDPIGAGLVAALPALMTVVAGAAPASSAPNQTGPIASLPSPATVPGPISTAPSSRAPAADSDEATVAAPATQSSDATGQHGQVAASAALDLLTTLPLPASTPPATAGPQPPALPASAAAATNAASDQNPQSAPILPPIITSDAPSGTIKPAAAAAALNPPALLTPPAAEIQVAAESAGNPSPPREAGAVQISLPAQIAVRFAAPTHSADNGAPDDGSDVLGGFGGASVGATATPGSGILPGAAIAPSFTGLLSTMQAAPGAMAAPQHAAVATDPVPLAAVPIAIVTRAEAGERKFEIRLDPPDLGRIEVQLNVDSSGRATSHLVVDRADTLDLLRRDAPILERALQSAGLTTDSGSLQFSLRDQSFAGRNQGTPAPLTPPTPATGAESEIAPLDAAVRRYGPMAGLGGGIDISV